MPNNALQNLIIAERVCNYVGQKMTKGASNKPIDLAHSKMRHDELPFYKRWFSSQDLASTSVDSQRVEVRNQGKNLPLSELVFANARTVEASGIGNCGEQASVAFKYLCDQKLSDKFCLASLGHNHEFIIIGANGQQVNGMQYIGVSPDWPVETVVCDPWYNEWFVVQTDWTRKIRSILKETEPGWTQVQTQVRAIINGPV